MKNLFLNLFLFNLLIINGLAQNTEPIIQKNFIEVTGVAEIEIVPDEIFIGITLRERMVNREKLSIESQEDKMKTSLKNVGIDLKNLSLADASAGFRRVRGGKKDVIASKNYILKISTVEELNKAFDEFDKLDIQEADVQRVSHTKLEQFRKEVKIKAIQAAKAKAEYLLEAIGEKLGKPISIVENGNYDVEERVLRYATNEKYGNIESLPNFNYEEEDNKISFQKIKLKFGINAKFEIK